MCGVLFFVGVPSILLRPLTRARQAFVAALKEQAVSESRAADAEKLQPRPGCFHPDMSPLMRARLQRFTDLGMSDADIGGVNAVLVWGIHANTSAALFWAVAHIYSGRGLG
jgi:hypothetical protein